MQWQARGGNVRTFFRPHLLLLALVPAGLVAYMFHLHVVRGDFFLPLHAQTSGWGKTLTLPWQSFLWSGGLPVSHIPLYQAIVRQIILTGSRFLFPLACDLSVYAVVSYSSSVCRGAPWKPCLATSALFFPSPSSSPWSTFRWKWLYEPLLAFSVALLALCTVLFANAYHMT